MRGHPIAVRADEKGNLSEKWERLSLARTHARDRMRGLWVTPHDPADPATFGGAPDVESPENAPVLAAEKRRREEEMT